MNRTSRKDVISHRLRRQAAFLTACFRGLPVLCHIIYGMLLAAIYPALDMVARRRILKHWSRNLLDLLRVTLDVHGSHSHSASQRRLFVANHISWLDVIALNAVNPTCFIAKSEVRDWPLLGWMCDRVNTLFIKRTARQDAVRINRQLAEMLGQGECVTLFPEGTTTDGKYPGHFHSSLLQGPIDTGAIIHPVAIHYHDGGGNPNSDAAYVADMTFVQSLWKILCSPSLHVTLAYLPALHSTGKPRRMLASQAQGAIHTALAVLSRDESVHMPDGAMTTGWPGAAQPCPACQPVAAASGYPSRNPPAQITRALHQFLNNL